MVSVRFVETIKVPLLISKFFGSVSFKMETNRYSVSKLNIAINIVLVLTFGTFVILALINHLTVAKNSILTKTTDALEILSACSHVIVVWISSAIYQQKHINLLMKIKNIEKRLQKLNVWMCFKKNANEIRIKIIIRYIGIILCIITQTLFYEFERSPHGFILHSTFYIPIIINSTICQLFLGYISIIKESYTILNRNLQQISIDIDHQPHKPTLKIRYLQNKVHVLKIISKLHQDLTKIVHDFNAVFGVVLLGSFGVTFVVIIIDFYYCIPLLQKPSYKNLTIFIATLCNCSPYIIESCLLCHACNSTNEEVSTINAIPFVHIVFRATRQVY